MGWKSSSVKVDSLKWRRLRQRLLKERGRYCSKCQKATGWLECDHIIPVYKGGEFYNEKNIQILCKTCHRNKTDSENPHIGPESRKWRRYLREMLKD